MVERAWMFGHVERDQVLPSSDNHEPSVRHIVIQHDAHSYSYFVSSMTLERSRGRHGQRQPTPANQGFLVIVYSTTNQKQLKTTESITKTRKEFQLRSMRSQQPTTSSSSSFCCCFILTSSHQSRNSTTTLQLFLRQQHILWACFFFIDSIFYCDFYR